MNAQPAADSHGRSHLAEPPRPVPTVGGRSRDHDHNDHAARHGDHAARHGDHAERHGDHAARHGDHAGGHGDHAAQFGRLFWINLVLAGPVIAFSSMFAMLIGYDVPAGTAWVAPALGTVMYLWGGKPFLTGAVAEIRARAPGMMLLVALAITVAFFASWGASLGLLHHALEFWWELALLIVIMLLGHWIEMRSLARTTSALDSLAALLPDEAERLEGEEIIAVPLAELRTGDVVLVRPGGSIPADGRVVEGRAELDESMLTGESRPVPRGVGDTVTAGTVATDSGLRVEVTATGDATALAGIRRLVSEAQNSSSRAQRLADRAAAWLFWYAVVAAVLTAVVWVALGDPDAAVMRTITVLVIACPHALGLAIPLVVAIATERAARGGVLVKDRLALEAMRTVDVVLFDKTGTLTRGEPVVAELMPLADLAADEVLGLAAAAEADSEHPLARAIVRAARERATAVPVASRFVAAPAVGVTATVDGHQVRVGGPRLLAEVGAEGARTEGARTEGARTEGARTTDPDPGRRARRRVDSWRREGAIVLHVVRDGVVVGALKLADEVRPESRAAVDGLHRRGIEVVMITGDEAAVARTVADDLGIGRVFAGVRPQDKSARVAQLQVEGRTVAMVGDGVNDAPALARADVGIAIGAGTDVAIGSAGVILAGDDPRSVLSVIELSRASYRKMKQNLWWAAGYNLAAVPLAAGVLAGIGFVLPMSVGAILMSLSTVVVALNAQLLRRLDLRPGAGQGVR